jgi:phage head maturation protease
MKLYAEISKTEEQDDGTVKVWGYASSGAVDSDGETITPEAMKAALPDYMAFGAVREMHGKSAAGTAIEASVEDDGRTFFGAHVVDTEAVKKVKANVYKGFSIGGKVTERDTMNKSIIKGIKLIEVSLVDRPANPEALFTMYKAEEIEKTAVDELAELLDSGEITPERLVELAKAEKPPEPESASVEKGMYSVAMLAQVLCSLNDIKESSEWEAEYEGDNSPIPAKLKDAVNSLAAILVEMTQEETAELTADPDALIEPLQMAESTGDLEKAGAAFSASAKDKLKKAHDAVKTASDHLSSLGYDETGKAESADDLVKMTDKMTKLESDNADLAKRVAELEAQPAPAKGVLKVVEKGQDIALESAPDESEITKGMTPQELALYEIKKVYATGGRSLSQR